MKKIKYQKPLPKRNHNEMLKSNKQYSKEKKRNFKKLAKLKKI